VTQQTCDAIFRRVSVFKKKSVFSTFAKLKKKFRVRRGGHLVRKELIKMVSLFLKIIIFKKNRIKNFFDIFKFSRIFCGFRANQLL